MERRTEVVNQLSELSNEVAVVLHLLSNEDVVKMMETMRDPKAFSNHITKEYGVGSVVYLQRIRAVACVVISSCFTVRDREDGKYVQIGEVSLRMR